MHYFNHPFTLLIGERVVSSHFTTLVCKVDISFLVSCTQAREPNTAHIMQSLMGVVFRVD